MCKKKFYVKKLKKVVYANVSFRYNRIIYKTNKNEIIMCSLSDFILILEAIEIDKD